MARYIARRTLQMFLLFLVFLTLTFFLLQALPGDNVTQRLVGNPNLPPAARTIAIERMGLDRPVWQQYTSFMVNFFQFDFGFSYNHYPRPVVDIIKERLPRTLVLFLTAVLTYYWAGFAAGKFIAWRRGKRGEHAITVGGVTLYTAFYPWFALMMIWLFAFRFSWLPINQFLDQNEWRDAPYASNTVFTTLFLTVFIAASAIFGIRLASRRLTRRSARVRARWLGYTVVGAAFAGFWSLSGAGSEMRPFAADLAEHMVLPVLTLTLINFAGIMLLTRTSMLETMREDFILTARAKGLRERQIRDRHAARTALLPVTTSLVLAIAAVIDGGIITETVFSWPGMGQLLFESVVTEDTPLAMAAFSFIGVLAMLGHLAVDIIYGFLDPRIRVG